MFHRECYVERVKMSANGKKKPRKTKLVPRMYTENDNENNTDKQMSAIKIIEVKTVAAESFETPPTVAQYKIYKMSANKVPQLKNPQTNASQSETPATNVSKLDIPPAKASRLKTTVSEVSQFMAAQAKFEPTHSRVSLLKTSAAKVSQLKAPQRRASQANTRVAVGSQIKASQSNMSLLKTSATNISQVTPPTPKVSQVKPGQSNISQSGTPATIALQSATPQPTVSQFEISDDQKSHIPFRISVNVEVEEFEDEDRLQIDESAFENQEIKMEIDDEDKIDTQIQKDTESSSVRVSEQPDDPIIFQNIVIKNERISPARDMEIVNSTDVHADLQANVTIKIETKDSETTNQSTDNNVNSNLITQNNVNSAQVTSNNVNSIQITNNDINLNQISDSNVSSNQLSDPQVPHDPNTALNQYLLTETQILEASEKILATSSNIADKILAIEARNIIGRIAKEKTVESNLIENKIQYALDDWKNWTAGSRRPSPLLYKCYICLQSWWYLSEYKEHLLQHTESNIKVSVEETSVEECNIISYIDMVPEILDVEPTGICWRCEKDYSVHKLSNRQSECYYNCKKCQKQFYSCTGLREHEDINPACSTSTGTLKCFLCPNMSTTIIERRKHMQLKHSVRTDLPIPTSYKCCNDCGSKYFIYNMHNCRNKICGSQCNYCYRKFTHRLLAELHMSIDNSGYKCKICTLVLPKKCMELEHVLMHSTTFIFPYKCITCADFYVYLDENVSVQHRYIKHKQKFDKKKNYFDKVLVPISCILPNYESPDNDLQQLAEDTINVQQNIPELSLIPEIKLEVIDDDEVQIKQEPVEELVIKEEKLSDEEYEDDMIRLNYEHAFVHSNNKVRRKRKIYTCRKCPFEGTHKRYKRHLITKCGRTSIVMSEPRVYACTKCNFQGHHSVYKEHLKTDCSKHTYLNESVYTCTKCDTTFESIKRYLAHFVCHKYKFQQCPVCMNTFGSFSTLIIHLNSHIRQNYLKMYSIQSNDDAAQRSNQVSKCKKCYQEVTVEDRFVHWERHLMLNSSVSNAGDGKGPVVVDDDDDNDGDNYSGLKPEMLEVLIESLQSELRQRIRDCPQCFRTFNRNNDCKRHFIEHFLSDAYSKWHKYGCLKCQICGDEHRKPDKYKRHMRDHGCLPIFQCEVCDKAFSDSSNFTKHKKVHNMKVLICDLCKKKFQAKNSLIKHMEMHKLSKPVSCHICDKDFPTDSLYRRHMRTRHDNSLKRNYKCHICKETFYTCKEKWEHSWEVHKERKFNADCNVCGKSFRTHLALKRHDRSNMCRPNAPNVVLKTTPKTFRFDNSIVLWYGDKK